MGQKLPWFDDLRRNRDREDCISVDPPRYRGNF